MADEELERTKDLFGRHRGQETSRHCFANQADSCGMHYGDPQKILSTSKDCGCSAMVQRIIIHMYMKEAQRSLLRSMNPDQKKCKMDLRSLMERAHRFGTCEDSMYGILSALQFVVRRRIMPQPRCVHRLGHASSVPYYTFISGPCPSFQRIDAFSSPSPAPSSASPSCLPAPKSAVPDPAFRPYSSHPSAV